MRPRLNLWLKKRGKRRTGSQRWAASGEVLYHSVFVVVGVIAGWLHITGVMIPEWQRRAEFANFVEAPCIVGEGHVRNVQSTNRAIGSVLHVPECRVRVRKGDTLTEPVWAPISGPTTSWRRADRLQKSWENQGEAICWVDPNNPSRVVLSREWRGWPAMVLTIPASLVILGIFGISRALLRTAASQERQKVVAQGGIKHELASKTSSPAGSLSLTNPGMASGLPSAEAISDSPGVRMRYRLPGESGRAWRVAGMAMICIAWNTMVGFFLFGVIRSHWFGLPNWPVTLVVTPLAIAGGWLAYQLLRDAWGVSGVGATRIEITNHPLRPGSAAQGAILQAGQFTSRAFTVSLVCQEIATYHQGTDTRTSVEEVHRQALLRHATLQVEPGQPYEAEFNIELPAGVMHSFQSPHNEVRWFIEVSGTPKRWPAFTRRFQFCVYPASWPAIPESPTVAQLEAASEEVLA